VESAFGEVKLEDPARAFPPLVQTVSQFRKDGVNAAFRAMLLLMSREFRSADRFLLNAVCASVVNSIRVNSCPFAVRF